MDEKSGRPFYIDTNEQDNVSRQYNGRILKTVNFILIIAVLSASLLALFTIRDVVFPQTQGRKTEPLIPKKLVQNEYMTKQEALKIADEYRGIKEEMKEIKNMLKDKMEEDEPSGDNDLPFDPFKMMFPDFLDRPGILSSGPVIKKTIVIKRIPSEETSKDSSEIRSLDSGIDDMIMNPLHDMYNMIKEVENQSVKKASVGNIIQSNEKKEVAHHSGHEPGKFGFGFNFPLISPVLHDPHNFMAPLRPDVRLFFNDNHKTEWASNKPMHNNNNGMPAIKTVFLLRSNSTPIDPSMKTISAPPQQEHKYNPTNEMNTTKLPVETNIMRPEVVKDQIKNISQPLKSAETIPDKS